MKVRIQNDGGPGYLTKITNAETGERLDYVTHLEFELNARTEVPTARLTVIFPVIDIIADAEIRHVCPMCGKPVDVLPESQ